MARERETAPSGASAWADQAQKRPARCEGTCRGKEEPNHTNPVLSIILAQDRVADKRKTNRVRVQVMGQSQWNIA